MDPSGLAIYELGEQSLLYRVRSLDKFVIREIWRWDEYFLSRVSLGPGAIVDVGAHIGAFSVRAAVLFPGHSVLALEPERSNFELLCANLERNGCRAVTPLELALAARSGPYELKLDARNTAGHGPLAVGTEQAPAETRIVRALGLEQLLGDHAIERIALLKLDCEGGEVEVLESPELARCASRIDNLVFEYHPLPGASFEGLSARLTGLGFDLTSHKQGYVAGQGTALFQRAAP